MEKSGFFAERTNNFQPMPGAVLQRKCGCGSHSSSGECGECAKKKGSLQRKNESSAESSGVPSIVGDVLRSAGQPLDANTRAFMEPRFGRDFSAVRVHTDSRAADSARAVNARAYTVGNNIAFAAGRYAPRSQDGMKLLAHELTHTIQQGNGSRHLSGKLEMTGSSDPSEREADVVAQNVMRSGRVPAFNHTGISSMQRLPDNPFNPLGEPREEQPFGQRFGSTLPYREAHELSECMRIMGPDSGEYCREQVTGEGPTCPADKQSKRATASIQPVVVADDDGKNPTPTPPLASVHSIWGKCCMNFNILATKTIKKTSLKTIAIRPPVGGAATADETALFTAAGNTAGIQIICVDQFSRDGVTGKNVAGGGKTYDAATASPRIAVVSGVVSEVVAHEVGHAAGFLGHDANPTVMKPTGAHDSPNDTAVSKDVCTRARSGSAVTVGNDACCLNPS